MVEKGPSFVVLPSLDPESTTDSPRPSKRVKELRAIQSEILMNKLNLTKEIEELKNQTKMQETELEHLTWELDELNNSVEQKTVKIQNLCDHPSQVASSEFVQNLASLYYLFSNKSE